MGLTTEPNGGTYHISPNLDPLASEILKAKVRREKANGKLILITSHILSNLDELTTDASCTCRAVC